jgi:hypothetical protein
MRERLGIANLSEEAVSRPLGTHESGYVLEIGLGTASSSGTFCG